MRVTIKDVARESGVSVATASMALNNRSGINALTRDKVLQVARALNYVPNQSARMLVTQDSNCIGLLLPEIQNPFYSAIVDILTRMAEEREYTLLLGITNNSARQEAEYVKMFLSWRVRGVIAVPMLRDHPDVSHLDLLRAADIPIVFCTERYAGCEEPVSMCDFAKGQYMATRYLLDKGMTDFWFASTNMDSMFARLRYEGYVRALREAGIAVRHDRELMLEAPRFDYAYAAADRIIADLPEAVICINDIMTMAIVMRFSECGIHVPEDVSVVGFDDIMFSRLLSPKLTTVRQPLEEICGKAMEIMEQKINDAEHAQELGRGEMYLIEPELIVRETTI